MCWLRGHEHLAAHVAALLLAGQLVLEVHAGGPGVDHRRHELVGVERAAEAGFGIRHDRRDPVDGGTGARGIRLGEGDLVGAQQRVVDSAHDRRHRVRRVQALVGVGLPGQVGVGGDLPAGEVDRLQPGAHLLHRLVAGERAERGNPLSCRRRRAGARHRFSAPRRASVRSSRTVPRRAMTSSARVVADDAAPARRRRSTAPPARRRSGSGLLGVWSVMSCSFGVVNPTLGQHPRVFTEKSRRSSAVFLFRARTGCATLVG